MSKPNIILLTIDTLRPDRLGCYGRSPSLTPNIDRLAENGIRFTQAITGGSWTQAAFPVLLTSTNASMHGGCLGPLSPDRPSPIQTLAEHGYSTAGFSTSPLLNRSFGYDRDFDYYVDSDPGEKDPWLRNVRGGHLILEQPIVHFFSGLLDIKIKPPKLYYSAAEITNWLCDWIDDAEKPFFVWAHFMDIHWPYHLDDTLTRPSEIAQAWKDVVHLHNANWNNEKITPDQRDHYIQLYEDAVSYTDTQLGRLFDFIKEKGLDQNTLIILVSDHGEEFLEHERWGHWEDNLFDEILKVPLMIRLPGNTQKKVITEQVRTLDLFPTILDICDCNPPEGMLGTSLLPLWEGNREYDRSSIAISEMWRDSWHIIAVRNEKYKYIWDNKKPHQPLLYNLEVDQAEEQNISSTFPKIVAELHTYVEEVLSDMERTKVEHQELPNLDDEMISRLRDLGYVR